MSGDFEGFTYDELRAFGYDVEDMEDPEDNPFAEDIEDDDDDVPYGYDGFTADELFDLGYCD